MRCKVDMVARGRAFLARVGLRPKMPVEVQSERRDGEDHFEIGLVESGGGAMRWERPRE